MEFRDWLNEETLFSETEDLELLSAARAGDPSAMSQLMSKWQRLVRRHVVNKVTNRDDAEELAQDILVKIMANIGDAEPEKFHKWAWTVVRHSLANWYRSKKLPTTGDPEETQLSMSHLRRSGIGLPTASSEEDPATMAAEGEHKQLMHKAMDELAQQSELQERNVRMLKKMYLQGMKMHEIAAEEELPLGTVKRVIKITREKLAKMLARKGVE
jgi:RNA polymerase sigma-70 factor (ECF subfamily)